MGLFALGPPQIWQPPRLAVAVGVLGTAIQIRRAHHSQICRKVPP
jgi:hypothetical protein